MPNAATPLAGARVVEVGRGHAAALLGRLLFDLGAEVVPVGEPAEAAGGFERWVRDRGRAADPLHALPGLLATADVLIYDDRGERALAEQGIAMAGLVEERSDLVAVRLSPFGLTGPLAGSPATEATLQALAGLTAATGAEADPPLLHRVGLASRTAALSGLLAVGAGLIGRDRGAGGDHYDIAEFDSLLTHLGTLLPTVALTGQRPPRRGNRHGMAAPWNSYRCADSHVMVCSMGEAMWRRLAETIGRPDLPDDPRFADSVARVTNVDALDEAITAWTSVRSAADVLAAMRAAGVPAATVSSPAEVRDGELAANRELVAGSPREPRSPVRSLRLRIHRTPGARTPVGEIRRLPTGAPPLQGLRVIELGAFTAGPGAGRLLAQLGADVLKVEPPHGEGARRLAQRIDGTGYLYFVNNAGKRACRLDLGAAADCDTLVTLLAGADLLLTNLASDTLAAAGLGPDQVLARHNLVYLGISGHGDGVADRSFDTVIQAESGIMHLVGKDTDGPRRTAVSSVDVLGGYLAATAAVLATRQRLLTGRAGAVDVALFDVAAWLTQDAWFGDPQSATPRLEVAGDGTVVLDGPPPQRGSNVAEVLESALAVGTPAAPLLDVTSVVSHPQVLGRSMVVEQRHHDIPFLNLGDHLRSIRRPPRVPDVAPADQDSPVWLTDVAEPACAERKSMTTTPDIHDLEDLIYEAKDGVATITINRERVRNALRTRTYEELTTAVTTAADDGTVGVIVIRGAGDKAFSSGGDVNDQRGRTATVGRIHLRRLLALGAAMQECGKPIIAAVRGFCVGAGHELHLMCDLTVCTTDSQFGQVGPRVGSVPMWGATQMLPRIVGEKKAREMIYLTKLYTAAEAERMGLVNEVVEPERLDEAVDAMCQRLLDASPQSLRIAKTSLNFALDSMRPAFTSGAEMLSLMYGTDEQGEGAAAFLEKRSPDFRKFRVLAAGSADGE